MSINYENFSVTETNMYESTHGCVRGRGSNPCLLD